MFRERADWVECRDGLPVPFDTYHRNDQPEHVRAATGDLAPVVAAETDEGIVVLLSAVELDRCSGSPERLAEALTAAAATAGLRWE
jgi:hypothetical protein